MDAFNATVPDGQKIRGRKLPIIDVVTRWGSTYLMLERALLYAPVSIYTLILGFLFWNLSPADS